MTAITINNLTDATLPILGTDKTVVSRDGTLLNNISITDVNAGLTPTMNTAAPNATVPVEALVATNSNGTFANIDVAIVPKGTGAFSLQVADNAITGGNKRGANAVDLQTSRTAATQVASGSRSFVAGQNNTASGAQSVAIGQTNTASGSQSIAVGSGNTCSGFASIAAGAQSSATANNAFAFGFQANATGVTSFAIGAAANATGLNSGALGQNCTTNGIQGQVAFGHNSDALGRYQTTLTGLRQVTTGTTATRATADGATAATANQLTLRNNSVFKFMGRVVAYDLTTLDAKEWEFSGLIKRGANAAATSLVGTPSVTSQFADTNAAAWMVAVSADTTNGALAVTVTGAGANQIRWYVEVFAYETGV